MVHVTYLRADNVGHFSKILKLNFIYTETENIFVSMSNQVLPHSTFNLLGGVL